MLKKMKLKEKKKSHFERVNPILERGEALKNLEKLTVDISNAKNYYGDAINEKEKKTIEEAIRETDDWISKNPNAKKEDTERKQKELKDKVDPIFARGQAIMGLEKIISDYQNKKNDLGDVLTEKEKATIERETKNASEWLKSHPNSSQNEIEKKDKRIKRKT